MTFVPTAEQALAHRLHLAGVAGSSPAVTSSYRKADLGLRRSLAGRGQPAPSVDQLERFASVRSALSVHAEDATLDAGWFADRWRRGEGQAVDEASQRVAQEANAVPAADLLPPDPIPLQASPAVARAVAVASPWRATVGMRVAGVLAVLEVVAERLPTEALLRSAPSPVAAMARRHVAASALIRLPDMANHVDHLLEVLAPILLPARGQEEAAGAALMTLAERWLDQPPGEARRLASGWHRGRTDRLHRAWLRGFFAPRGFDLDVWVRGQRQARTASASDA